MGIKDFVPSGTLNLIKQVTNEFVERSRKETEPNKVFDVDLRHSYEKSR